jgi:hypothetical protein
MMAPQQPAAVGVHGDDGVSQGGIHRGSPKQVAQPLGILHLKDQDMGGDNAQDGGLLR